MTCGWEPCCLAGCPLLWTALGHCAGVLAHFAGAAEAGDSPAGAGGVPAMHLLKEGFSIDPSLLT